MTGEVGVFRFLSCVQVFFSWYFGFAEDTALDQGADMEEDPLARQESVFESPDGICLGYLDLRRTFTANILTLPTARR